jgi:hypothetical protein
LIGSRSIVRRQFPSRREHLLRHRSESRKSSNLLNFVLAFWLACGRRTHRQKEETEMKKLSIAMAVLGAAVVFAGPLADHNNSPKAKRPSVPSTIQNQIPAPSCPPDCDPDPK